MDTTITVTVPSHWVQDLADNPEQLRRALRLGLDQLRREQESSDPAALAVQALLSTGRVRHLSADLASNSGNAVDRQIPPVLPGLPTSEVLIQQRRGEE